MRAALVRLMAESFDLGYIPEINKTLPLNHKKDPAIVISNMKAGKLAILGDIQNMDGSPGLVAFTVNVDRWSWASNEGFSIKDIFDNSKLFEEIFTQVPPDRLSQTLA